MLCGDESGLSLKTILVICDGMADRPSNALKSKTPLEAASKPNFDQMAKDGICGIIDPIAPGIPPGSDTSTLAMLGYDPFKIYSGRGALEAEGSGVEVLPGDVAFRCNFATVNENFLVLDRRAGRIANKDAAELSNSLGKIRLEPFLKIRFQFKNTVQHRAILVIRGPKLSSSVSDSDPEATGKRVLDIKPLDDSVEAKRTAQILNILLHSFHEVLSKHAVNESRAKNKLPIANMVLCRGAGTIPRISTLQEKYDIRPACVAAVPLIEGISKVAGMDLIKVKGATGTVQTDYMGKAKAAVQCLKNHDFVLLHVKATDVASHDGNFKLKVEVIEKIDKMLGHIIGKINLDSTIIAVTADHTTSSLTRNHEGDPVPVMMMGPGVRCDDVTNFSERACAKGGLNRIRGLDLMPTLISLMGKTKKFGA